MHAKINSIPVSALACLLFVCGICVICGFFLFTTTASGRLPDYEDESSSALAESAQAGTNAVTETPTLERARSDQSRVLPGLTWQTSRDGQAGPFGRRSQRLLPNVY